MAPYNHSGIQAIRAAVAAGTNITYKILFNDAVAMTGGQGNDGGLSAARIAREVLAMGIETVALVYDDKEELDLSAFPKDISKDDRTQLLSVQKRLSETEGVSVLIYVQTCAAEKRRRRKRGKFPDPNKRIFINSDVCEGCGDCGVQSNCVAIAPLETAFGRKRMIDQSACNKDFSCVSGFCPSFVTLEGATPRKAATTALDLPEMPLPPLAPIEGTWNVVVTGIGGTGVVTLGAVIAQAAQLDGKGAGMMEMAGLAQKGGAVHIHCRLAEKPADISAIRVATGECDVLIGGDLVVSAGAKTLGLTQSGRTGAVVNSHEAVSGEFTRDTEFQIPHDRLSLSLEARLQERLDLFDASALAKTLMGDSIFSNMMVLGGAWQRGYLPLSHDALKAAIELNGAAVEKNLYAFELGRWAVLHLSEAQKLLAPSLIKLPQTLDEKIAIRADHLKAYQGRRLRKRYLALVSKIENPELKELVAKAYHKLLAYKDEYEVARLHRLTRAKAAEQFENIDQITYHLAPPLLSKLGPDGRPLKRQFGAWIEKAFGVLARFKFLRGNPF
jgi:indolepyruvate ferredoxin oxidoreductase